MEVVETNKLIGNYGDFRKYSHIFCETGSCMGRSIQLALKAGYTLIKSVEAKEEYNKYCQELFMDLPSEIAKVDLFWGKSVDKLPEMVENINEPIVFFLDAHVSGEASAGYQDWVEKGGESDYDQDKVLKAEIKFLLERPYKDVFIIDDQNSSTFYADYIESIKPNTYRYFLYDEQMGEYFYKNKMLVAVPYE